MRGYTQNKNFTGSCAIIGRQGAYCGNVHYYSGEAYMTEHAVIAEPNNKANARFLAYYLGLLPLIRLQGQSAQPGLAVSNLRKLKLELPEMAVQERVAKLLSALDSKIEHNKRMIERLEKQAQLLYDYWFLQFDFPDENGRPYRSSGGKMVWNETLKREIPAGWKVKKLSNLIETLKTGKLDANAAEKDGKYPFFTCSAEPMRINSFSYDGDVIILSGNGEFYLFDYNGRFDAYQRNYVIRPKKGVCKQYLYQEIARNIRLLKSQAQGSIIKFLTKGMIEKIPVFDLDWKSHRVLEEVLRNLFARCSCLKKEIEVLTAQRDYLLPLLMTGQVRVEA